MRTALLEAAARGARLLASRLGGAQPLSAALRLVAGSSSGGSGLHTVAAAPPPLSGAPAWRAYRLAQERRYSSTPAVDSASDHQPEAGSQRSSSSSTRPAIASIEPPEPQAGTNAASQADAGAVAAPPPPRVLPPPPSFQQLLEAERARMAGGSRPRSQQQRQPQPAAAQVIDEAGVATQGLPGDEQQPAQQPEETQQQQAQRARATRQALFDHLDRFGRSGRAMDTARGDGINTKLYNRAHPGFKKWLLRAATPELEAHLLASPRYNASIEALLLSYFVPYCERRYADEMAALKLAVATLDLRAPHTWYPYARAIKRRIIYHAGPTNSGKTYNALQALAAAPRGVYAGPLRLLAMEVYEELNAQGVRCDMRTGQEVVRVPGAGHVACTVEMANLQAHCDVAVIDEIQMIADEQRGFAWTRALLGLPANELHVCGDPGAIGLVRALAAECGDDFTLAQYERMTPLRVDEAGLPNGFADVREGDCVVAFSRRELHEARRHIEELTGQRTCIVYGALPAETRRAQARTFNDPASDAKVLVASDAVGMGLNFNIRRVVFTTMRKRTGATGGKVPVPLSLVKQIAGRAGRRSSAFPEGLATCLQPSDMQHLRACLAAPPSALTVRTAGLLPEYELVELLAAQLPGLAFDRLLSKFASEARLDGTYFFCNQDELVELARSIKNVPNLSLEDRYTFCMAPVARSELPCRRALQEFALTYASGAPVAFHADALPSRPPRNLRELKDMETWHKVLSLWLWLSLRFEEGVFPGRQKMQGLAQQLCRWMNEGLRTISPTAGAGSDEEEEAGRARAGQQHQQQPGAVASAAEAAGAGTGGHDSLPARSSFSAVAPESAAAAAAATAAADGEGGDAEGAWGGGRSVGVSSSSSSSATFGAALGGSLEELHSLLVPEYDASMSRYIRMTNPARIVVPPPPA